LAEVFVDGDEAVEAGGVVEFLAHDFVGGLFDAGVVEDGFEDVLHGLFGVGFVKVRTGLVGGDVGVVCVAAAGHADVHQGTGEVVGDQQVGGVDGGALGSVGRGGIGEFDGVRAG
jgi:hypothetical protein